MKLANVGAQYSCTLQADYSTSISDVSFESAMHNDRQSLKKKIYYHPPASDSVVEYYFIR